MIPVLWKSHCFGNEIVHKKFSFSAQNTHNIIDLNCFSKATLKSCLNIQTGRYFCSVIKNLNLIKNHIFASKLTINPAGTQRLYNVASTSTQRHDVALALRPHCINSMCPQGRYRPCSSRIESIQILCGLKASYSSK